jgi:hypothetical protein
MQFSITENYEPNYMFFQVENDNRLGIILSDTDSIPTVDAGI